MVNDRQKKKKPAKDPWYGTDDDKDESNWDAMDFVEEEYEDEVPPLDDFNDEEEW